MFKRILIIGLLAFAMSQSQAIELPVDYLEETSASEGYLNVYWNQVTGRASLGIPKKLGEILFVTSLPSGVGSNDLGLDRGQLGQTRIISFQRSGPRILMVESNLDYRAESDNLDEKQSVKDAFASSVLAAFEIQAENDELLIIDYTDYLLTDVHGVATRLSAAEQGNYRIDVKRSAPLPKQLKSFPDNSVLEAWVTFSGDKPGEQISSVTPTPTALTVRMRHEFVRLPDNDYRPRAYHPRSGYFPFGFKDYAASLGESIDRRYIVRHRLSRNSQGQVKPLVYYVDRGAPEPVRSALIEGASWWAQAFEAAGFPGVFQVKLLPDGVDPMDIRYNVIQWVHRSTRGWSYGASVVDPRTGEILKGHISLGSLRVRQDMMIAEGLLTPYGDRTGNTEIVEQMALARLRQLSAHEVGHTLGLAHNFAGSNNNEASVMDYPHPYVRLDEQQKINLDRAYDRDIGEWDKLAINYGYREFATEIDEQAGLKAIVEQAVDQGLRFISDPDTRGPATPHAYAHLWDNGGDSLQRFEELMQIRSIALEKFGPDVLKPGEVLSELERKLVPIFLIHRFQAEAVAKAIGGLDYDYLLKAEVATPLSVVSVSRQRAAFAALLGALAADQLTLSQALLDVLTPPAYGYGRDREYFTHNTAAGFDSLAPAKAGAQLVLNLLLDPARMARIYQQQQTDPEQLGLSEYMQNLVDTVFADLDEDSYRDAVGREVAWLLVRQLQRLVANPGAADSVKAGAYQGLNLIERKLKRSRGAARVFGQAVQQEISRFYANPNMTLPQPNPIPPGSPI